jgi:hypothetical protein
VSLIYLSQLKIRFLAFSNGWNRSIYLSQ